MRTASPTTSSRWYTLAGYEVVPATGRPLLSVPYMFNYRQPFTHLGALTTWHITDKFNLYNGAINGWDRRINLNDKWDYIGGFNWTFMEDKTDLAFTLTAVWRSEIFRDNNGVRTGFATNFSEFTLSLIDKPKPYL
jgi:hypothetical protein